MKKAIITGATGMIGINLIKYLINNDVEVTAIIRPNSERKWILNNFQKLRIIECDLENIENANVLSEEYDVMYHLAWSGTTGDARNNVELQLKNIQYTLNTIKLAKMIKCKKIIGAGSQAEYGNVEGKLTELTSVNPQTAYGIAKLFAVKMGKILAENLGIEFIWTRILSIYGEYDGKNTMVMSSIIKMLNGESPKYTKAEQMWDYLYVGDVAKAMYLLGEKGKNGEIYCIGSGKAQPLNKYIKEIKEQISPNLDIKFGEIPYAKNQVMYLCADISKLNKDTGFKPEVSFNEGIKNTIQWYKEIENEKNKCSNTSL